jgi:hypothetical protein
MATTQIIRGTPGPPPILQTIRLEGRLPLRPGDEVTIADLGRARYGGKVNSDGSIDVFRRGWRSVMPDRIRTVHRKPKIR